MARCSRAKSRTMTTPRMTTAKTMMPTRTKTMMTSLRPLLALLLICVSRAAFAQQAAPVASLKNDFFSLQPNYQLVYEDDAKPKPNRLTVLILGEVKKLGQVEARAVERRE